MKYLTLLSVIVPVALAQSSSDSANSSSSATSSSSAVPATSSADPLVPTTVSDTCQTFLQQLDSSSSLEACLQPILSASSQFAPGSNSTPAASDVASALSSLCSASSGCDDSTIRTDLSNFWSACQTDLVASNTSDVRRIYDSLYSLVPLKDAVCAKDDSGNYCVTQATSNIGGASNTTNSTVKVALAVPQKVLDFDSISNNLYQPATSSPLARRDASVDNATAALIPNVTTYHETNLAFLFLSPDMAASQLCQPCTRSIMSQYITFEQSVPYGPTLQTSALLGGQSDLYQAIQQKCGANFMSGAVQAAGGIAKGLLSGAERTAGTAVSSVTAMLAALAFGVVTL